MEAPQSGLDLSHSIFNAKVKKVPVIVMFCKEMKVTRAIFVHGVFPYFYISYHGKDSKEYILNLKNAINQALYLYLGKEDDYVPGIILVKGIPYYGFHAGYSYFLKIYLYNPYLVSKLVQLLEKGWILGTKFQTFHSHLSFLLQFMIDFEIYGMGEVEFREIKNDHVHVRDIIRKVKERPRINLVKKCSNEVPEKFVPSLKNIWVGLNF